MVVSSEPWPPGCVETLHDRSSLLLFTAGGGRGKSSQTSSVAHIDPEGHSEKAKHAGVGGTENPSINHNVSSEYINGNDIKKEIKEDTPV